jgi:hypothetical protein
MPAGSTYTPIATTTLGSAAANVTFSSISSAYTDLVLVAQPLKSTAGGGTIRMQLNSDTGNNYSFTRLFQENNTTISDRGSNSAFITAFWNGDSQGNTLIFNFQNYSNTTTYKTVVGRSGNASAITGALVSLWRNTAAINTIYVYNDGGNFNTGSTFTLLGIAAA